jgi:hypothetical protein
MNFQASVSASSVQITCAALRPGPWSRRSPGGCRPRTDRRWRQQNVAVIFISHNLVDIFAVADRILVLRRGLAAVSGGRSRAAMTRSSG